MTYPKVLTQKFYQSSQLSNKDLALFYLLTLLVRDGNRSSRPVLDAGQVEIPRLFSQKFSFFSFFGQKFS